MSQLIRCPGTVHNEAPSAYSFNQVLINSPAARTEIDPISAPKRSALNNCATIITITPDSEQLLCPELNESKNNCLSMPTIPRRHSSHDVSTHHIEQQTHQVFKRLYSNVLNATFNQSALSWMKNGAIMRAKKPYTRSRSFFSPSNLRRTSSENALLLQSSVRDENLVGASLMRKSFSSGLLF